jgi:subtilisin family serine protease
MDASAHRAWHESLLPSKLTELGEPRLLRSYRFILNGFAALLTEAELQQVVSKPGFVAAFPNGMRHLRTTRTPAFLGLPDTGAGRVSTWKDSDYGSGAIIGLLDGGIDPRHPSMSDIAFPDEVPTRWKGSCHQGFYCNRKLIGAKNLIRPDQPPMDVASGHGTHTASIVAGSFVNDVSVNGGLANGTASGMAPWAHVAIYKVCDYRGCSDDAVIHAMDEAVHDGVDVISFSISQEVKTTYDRDVVAIAAYSAMEKGIPFVACAGNQGPGASTVENDVPWMFTVGAGTVDRSLEAKLRFTTGGDPILGQSMADRKRTQVAAGWYPVLYREDGERRYCLYPEAEM